LKKEPFVMADLLIDSTVTGIAGWTSRTSFDTIVVTTNGRVFGPSIAYSMNLGTNIALDLAGSMTLAGLSVANGNFMTIQSTGVLSLRFFQSGLLVGNSTGGSVFQNLGSVDSLTGGVVSDNGSFIYNAGRIQGQWHGVALNNVTATGPGDVLVNDGVIQGRTLSGVVVTVGTVNITNSGTITGLGNQISGEQAGIWTRALSFIDNSGLIQGTNFGIWTFNGGQNCTVHNSGTITGGQWSFSVNNGFTAIDRIFNTGVMNGEIYTGLGNDLVDSSNGTVNGNILLEEGDDTFVGLGAIIRGDVFGGAGGDTFTTDNPTLSIIEDRTPGEIDTVFASCSFRLVDNVEQLFLQGTADFRGWGNALANQIEGNAGDNRLAGLDGADTLRGGLGDDRITGGTMNDSIAGGDGDDTLLGGVGNDSLTGGEGDDLIAGGLGRDNLTGGTGADQFLFTALAQSGATPGSADILIDFTQGEDILNLTALDAKAGNANPNDSFALIGAAAFSSVAGQLRAAQSGGFTYLEADVTGDGTADFILRLTPLLVLTAADFAL